MPATNVFSDPQVAVEDRDVGALPGRQPTPIRETELPGGRRCTDVRGVDFGQSEEP